MGDRSSAIAAQLFTILSKLPSIHALDDLQDAISPAMHEDLEASPLDDSVVIPEGIDRSKCSYYNFDEAHSGRFSTFNTGGATIDPEHVLDRPDALAYIRDSLPYGDEAESKECCVFVQGLRTPSQPEEAIGGLIASDRIKSYSDILNGVRIAQVHTGTNPDQEDAKVDVRNTIVLRGVTALLSAAGIKQVTPDEDGFISVPPTVFDVAQAVLSGRGFIDTPIKKTLRGLLPLVTPETPLVLMVYSRGSCECAAALKEYAKAVEDKDEMEKHLRACVTVITVGAATAGWIDGPAYIHLSSYEDPLAKLFCSSNKNRDTGKDAVFLHHDSPYPGTFDAHNFHAATSQFLSVLMLVNNVSSFRKLWELAQETDVSEVDRSTDTKPKNPVDMIGDAWNGVRWLTGWRPSKMGGGKLVIPDNINDLTDAMIAITNGREFLWGKDDAIKVARPIPSRQEAMSVLKSAIEDREKVDKIVERFEFVE